MSRERDTIGYELLALLLLFILLMLFGSCTPTKVATATDTKSDSVRIEYRERVVERIDTAYIELPAQSQSVVIKDTFSLLENDYAITRATVLPCGMLVHDLMLKNKPVAVKVVTKEVVRDSIVYRDVEHVKETPVIVKKELSGFARLQMSGFWVLLLVTIGLLLTIIKLTKI